MANTASAELAEETEAVDAFMTVSGAGASVGAGDSDTDLEFLKDARVRLVVDRQKRELMCHALNGKADGWFITPLFYAPLAPKAQAYDCTPWGLPSV